MNRRNEMLHVAHYVADALKEIFTQDEVKEEEKPETEQEAE